MNAIEAGLYSKLIADTALVAELAAGTPIYNRTAPQDEDRTYIVFYHAGGGHENQNPSDMQNHVYMVKAVADEGKKAGTVHALIITALHGQTLTVSGYTNIWMAAEEEVQLTEVTRAGDLLYHTGSFFRIRIDS